MGIKPPFFTMGFLVLGLSPKYGLEPLMHERKWSGFKRLRKWVWLRKQDS
jgi:hypothetical protein